MINIPQLFSYNLSMVKLQLCSYFFHVSLDLRTTAADTG